MGNPKQKWKPEEEEALRAGIAKHGHGKWKLIKEDPQFYEFLSSRSNVDLKDKWRNIYKERIKITKPKTIQDGPASSLISKSDVTLPGSAVHQLPADHFKDGSANGIPDAKNVPRYDEFIFEALSTVREQPGLDIVSLVAYIEERMEVPQNFRKHLGGRLRRLVRQGKLDKVDGLFSLKNNYVHTNASNKDGLPRQSFSTANLNVAEKLEEAAKTAAYKVFEAETLSYVAADSVAEAEKIMKLAEETDSIMQLAKGILDGCTNGEIILVA
ncbi:telomere repeat-binding factor 4-like isoform X1 [Amaranthus tricolor]|uniref:telomere repeat-binding factor 4-like isoform X1 n=1 Tax=Amaranthus tricolor TaxID=29722 RepID=UPI00258560EB|nr:telomere repeat-binding factor 4-like isoform X1 [Amaranthus tricolor]